ncbi:tripartite tricarboxylate transporter substrate binding protein [Xanthobacter sp. KR7-225]|uniref:tripartite tricarboxylate transporter substrate binding protein n=1 Tax=Xanthobacter sp. KR7-225 TaxID=3156613 RepID=UPI0032B4D600
MRKILLSTLAMLVAVAAPAAAQAPAGAVTVIVPFTVGGLNDLSARSVVEKIKGQFPGGIAVVNRTGAGGSIGVTEIVQGKPDGTVIGLSPTPALLDQPQMNALPYKGPQDYTAIANTVTYYQLLAVRGDAPWKDIKELMAAAKAAPAKLRFGSSGIGTASHLNLAQLTAASGIDVVHVPFSGWAEGSAALLGGHVDTLIINPGEGRQLTNAGRVRVLAAFQPARSPYYPDVPTFKELGYDIGVNLSFAFVGPKGLPAGVTDFYSKAIRTAVEDKAFQDFAKAREIEVNYMDSARLAAFFDKEFKEHTALLDKLGLLKK